MRVAKNLLIIDNELKFKKFNASGVKGHGRCRCLLQHIVVRLSMTLVVMPFLLLFGCMHPQCFGHCVAAEAFFHLDMQGEHG